MNTLNQARQDAFLTRMVSMMNESALSLMISIGHQTSLFDTMAALSPSTSAEIAAAAHLQERYVREWLAAMTTGRIVDYDPDTKCYHLPPEHAAWLTKAAGENNVANQMQFIGLLGIVEDEIVQSFRTGGGVPYSKYPRFQTIMAEGSAKFSDKFLINTILPIVPGLIDKLERGISVLDVGCGQGHAINLMAKAFPNSEFFGYDFSTEGIESAAKESKSMGLSNSHFAVKDVSYIAESECYDFITAFDAIHDQAQPAKVLKEIYNALKPEGIFLMVDIGASSHLHENMTHNLGPFLYTVSTLHCMTVSLALDGAGLGTMWGEHIAVKMLQEAAFTNIEVKKLENLTFNYYYVAQKP